MAYSQLEPFGNELTLLDTHFAHLEALIYNANRDPKKSKSYEPEDFMLLKQTEEQEPREEQEPKKKRGPSFADAKTFFGLTGK